MGAARRSSAAPGGLVRDAGEVEGGGGGTGGGAGGDGTGGTGGVGGGGGASDGTELWEIDVLGSGVWAIAEMDGTGTVGEDAGSIDPDGGASHGDDASPASPDGSGKGCPSVDPGEPTGTASTTGTFGGMAAPMIDAIALARTYTSGGNNYGELEIVVTSFPGACVIEKAGIDLTGTRILSVAVREMSTTTMPAVPTTLGTFPLPAAAAGEPEGTPFGWFGGISSVDAGCRASGGAASMARTGSVTIESIEAATGIVTGSFTYTDLGETLSGTFSARTCSGFAGDPTMRCCMTGP